MTEIMHGRANRSLQSLSMTRTSRTDEKLLNFAEDILD